MALDYSKDFYNSTAWRRLRKYICEKFHWTCQKCGSYGNQVHHIIEITPQNINDSNITLNEENLMLLCEACHNAIRRKSQDVNDGLRWNENGDLIQFDSIPPVEKTYFDG